jgi:hypothetical protein
VAHNFIIRHERCTLKYNRINERMNSQWELKVRLLLSLSAYTAHLPSVKSESSSQPKITLKGREERKLAYRRWPFVKVVKHTKGRWLLGRRVCEKSVSLIL